MQKNNVNDLFEKIKDVTWSEVFDLWRKNEADMPEWKDAFKRRGFDSWDEWRMTYADAFKCPESEWGLYKMKEPTQNAGNLFGGPFRAWVELHYDGQKTKTFSELVEKDALKEHEKVKGMMKNFPHESVITALLVDDQVVIVEGMHRCCALALMGKQGIELGKNQEVKVAIGIHPGGELPVTGKLD